MRQVDFFLQLATGKELFMHLSTWTLSMGKVHGASFDYGVKFSFQ